MKSKTLLTHGMVALSLLMALSPAHAQMSRGVQQVQVLPAMVQQPGQYSYKQYDETKLQSDILNILEKRSQEDAEYIRQSVHVLNLMVNDFVNEQMNGGLTLMSDNSTTGGSTQWLSVQSFMAARRNYMATKEKINAQITAISALPSLMKSNPSLTVEGQMQQIQGRYNVDLTPVVKAFSEQLSAIDGDIQKLEFNIRSRRDTLITQTGLAISAELKASQNTAAEIQEMRMEANRMKATTGLEDKAVTNFNIFAIRSLNTAIDAYGKTFRVVDTDETGKLEALKIIEQVFFARSIMRLQYGIALGTPKLNYDLKKFNWDFFSTSNTLTFGSAGVTDANEQIDLHNAIATALKTQEARVKAVFGSDSNVFSKVTSSISFLKGERARVGMNIIMLKLLLADLEEDMKINQAGGRRALRGMVQARYYTTKANEIYFKTLGRDLSGVAAKGDIYADVGKIGVSSLAENYRLTATILKGYVSRVTQANEKEMAADEMDAPSVEKTKAINDDMFSME